MKSNITKMHGQQHIKTVITVAQRTYWGRDGQNLWLKGQIKWFKCCSESERGYAV